MLHCNDTITIYNAYFDPSTGTDRYSRTVIQGVSWHSRQMVNVVKEGLVSANTATIRIPAEADFGGAEYVTPHEFKTLEEKAGKWTLAPGDVIVHGEATETNPTAKTLKDNYAEVVTVIGGTDNRRGALQHWKVVGE